MPPGGGEVAVSPFVDAAGRGVPEKHGVLACGRHSSTDGLRRPRESESPDKAQEASCCRSDRQVRLARPLRL